MNNRQFLSVCMGILLLIGNSAYADSIANQFPVPPNAQVSIVSKEAKTLGMSLTIRKFSSDKGLQDIVKFYQSAWKEQAAVTVFPPWTMVGRRVKDKFYNVQIQSEGRGSWGYLSVSDLPSKIENNAYAKVQTNEFAAMGNTKILNNQQHSDLLNHSSSSLMSNRFSIEANRNFYLQHYQAQGWNLKQDSENSLVKSRVLLFNKGNRSISFTINYVAGETQIVANLIAAKRLGIN